MDVSNGLLCEIVLGYLRRHCRGRDAARTQKRIAADLADIGLDVTTRRVRDALAALVDAGWPVGTVCSRPAGAYLCQVRGDFMAAWQNLHRRFEAQARRLRRFEKTARLTLSGQQAFDFSEADARFAELAAAPIRAAAKAENHPGAPAKADVPDDASANRYFAEGPCR